MLSPLAQALFEHLKPQGLVLDKNRLFDASLAAEDLAPADALLKMLSVLNIADLPESLEAPDGARLPLIVYHKDYGFGRLTKKTHTLWRFEGEQVENVPSSALLYIAHLTLGATDEVRTFGELITHYILKHKWILGEAVIAGFIINFLALAVSMFSMLVYDKVIPTQATATLIVLASGVGIMVIFEWVMKTARSKIMDSLVIAFDKNLSRDIFERLLRVQVDKLPPSVGSLAAQLRGYEQVRAFYTASTLFGLVDLPMSLMFLALISFIGSPIIALVPLSAAIAGVVLGLTIRRQLDDIAKAGARASYQKTGILVETVEGIDTIKAGAGNWRFLSKWLGIVDTTVDNDLRMRHTNDRLNYSIQMLQQVSYVGMVIAGAFVVMQGNMSIGGLIASSILGGRILAPVMNIPNLLVQYSHAKAARANLEHLFSLPMDNQDISHPLAPKRIMGNYECRDVLFYYAGNDNPALAISRLSIKSGEKIAILGEIGSGKSTLLKVLAGLYTPKSGQVLLDGLEMNHISKDTISEQVGYLQQDHRLFEGTLRENLLIGMPAPSDDLMQQVLWRTGLIKLVSGHSSGLDLPIFEGGKGLSGGQKQLVAFTRLVLTDPSVWIMDEPTASMDNMQEHICLKLMSELDADKTLIVSTHKMNVLPLVDRIIVMANNQMVMDGPRDLVLAELRRGDQNKQPQG